MGIPVLEGRAFDRQDRMDGPRVVIVNQTFVKSYYPNGRALGRNIIVQWDDNVPSEIVGVVGNVRSRKVTDSDDVELYRPWGQENFSFLSIAVRSHLSVDAVTKSNHASHMSSTPAATRRSGNDGDRRRPASAAPRKVPAKAMSNPTQVRRQ